MALANYSVFALPAYYIISTLPHTFAITLIYKANNGKWDNSNPHSSNWKSKIQQSVPADVFAKYERAEAAHRNGMENLALFTGAIVLGNLAELPASTLNIFAAATLCLRVVYQGFYIYNTDVRRSFARTGMWITFVGMCFYMIVRSGIIIAKRSQL